MQEGGRMIGGLPCQHLQSEGVKLHTVGGAFVFFDRGSSSDEESLLLLPDFLFFGAGLFSFFLFGGFLVPAFFVGAFFAFAVAVLPPFFLDLGSYVNQTTNFVRIFSVDIIMKTQVHMALTSQNMAFFNKRYPAIS
jgi:hypothetical protein